MTRKTLDVNRLSEAEAKKALRGLIVEYNELHDDRERLIRKIRGMDLAKNYPAVAEQAKSDTSVVGSFGPPEADSDTSSSERGMTVNQIYLFLRKHWTFPMKTLPSRREIRKILR